MERLFRFFSGKKAKINATANETAPERVEETPVNVQNAHALMCEALLDKEFYLKQYPDIQAAGVDPLQHYIDAGHGEGRYPLNLRSADAMKRVSLALEHNSSDQMALTLHIILELESGTHERISAAATLYSDALPDSTPATSLAGYFEQAASFLFGCWIRYESTISIDEIKALTAKLLSFFPESQVLSAIYADLLFEAGEISLAEQEFARNPELHGLQPELESICRSAKNQILDAKAVNTAPPSETRLLLLDSAFPSKISSFRYGEFSTYLTSIKDSSVQTRPDAKLFSFGEQSALSNQVDDFCKANDISKERLRRFDRNHIGNPKVAYCVFLNLADIFFTQIGVPSADHLVFTLYPGGGFAPNYPRSDESLRRLCDNPKVKKIITTQITSYRYLIDKGFCGPERIVHIFGGIIPELYSEMPPLPRSINHSAINVCFVAQRYSAIGAEKGYDVFADVIKAFSNNPSINFHVVGGFDATIIDLGDARNVTFYGTRPATFFPDFYASMDVILSPNIQHSALDPAYPESFDGFPTTCVVEAGLQGVAMLLTDFQSMNQNLDGSRIFAPEEMEIINRDYAMICARLQYYMDNREELYQLGQSGRQAILREFSFERQMVPRIKLLESYLDT
jgi:glycosyltransferase involved in cell wall biosynthesis